VQGAFAPRELARQVCERSALLFRWAPGLPDLQDAALLRSPDGWSARLSQEYKGLPVDVSEIVVNVTTDGRLQSVYNQYHYDIPSDLDPGQARIGPVQARQLVARLAAGYRNREISPPRLIVHRHEPREKGPPPRSRRRRRRRLNERARFLAAVRAELARGRRRGPGPRAGTHVLAWDVRLDTTRPSHRWRLLVDAISGRLLEARDLLAYANGQARVFDPNPIVSSGDLGLSSATPPSKLNAERISVTLPRLDPPLADGRLRLDGAWVRIHDFGDPDPAEPASAAGHFVFSSTSPSFLAAMVYFHIDRFQQYIQTDLGLPGVGNLSVRVDPQLGTDDGSHGTGAGIGLGGDLLPDASDAMVILHEYGHFLQDRVNPESSDGNFPSGVAEGFGDFLAAVYYDDKHAKPAETRGLMFSWNANPSDGSQGRLYKLAAASVTAWGDGGGYEKGALWCSTMFELYRKLGGDSAQAGRKAAARDLAIRLHIVANAHVPKNDATVTQMGQEIEAADWKLGGWRYPNGLHHKVIHDTFSARHVREYSAPRVDVYIDDGRSGGYGSASGNDLFEETLWKERHDDARDVWVRTTGVAGSPADHVARLPVNAPAFVFARVRNRGTSASGPITVRAFRSAPGSPRRWPVDWTELPAPPGPMPTTVAAAPDAGVVVGPFPWTPVQTGPQAVLVVVESAADRAVTQDLPAGAQVAWMDLVPFDNNVAVREVRATPA
jgi:zinc metalloprotease ZmpB